MIFPSWREFLPERGRLRASRRKLVLANGCFDLLHAGHIDLLEQARTAGDCLLVAVNSDASVRAMKGDGRPILPQDERMELLAGLAAVDYVCPFDEPTPRELIQAILPDVLVKGADWGPGQVVGEPEVLAAGGRVERIPLAPGFSTTNIVARVLALP